MSRTPIPPAMPYREMGSGSAAVDYDGQLADAIINSSPAQAWQALQYGADPKAYVYCLVGPDLGGGAAAISREVFPTEREPEAQYFSASYMALKAYMTETLDGVKKTDLKPELTAIIDPTTRPPLEVSRERIGKKAGNKPASSPDMLDVAYALMSAGVEPLPIRVIPLNRKYKRLTH